MLDIRTEYNRLVRRGPSLLGITKRKLGEILVIEVDVTKAMWGNKRYSELNSRKRREFEDLLYISNVQDGNPKIIYTA